MYAKKAARKYASVHARLVAKSRKVFKKSSTEVGKKVCKKSCAKHGKKVCQKVARNQARVYLRKVKGTGQEGMHKRFPILGKKVCRKSSKERDKNV